MKITGNLNFTGCCRIQLRLHLKSLMTDNLLDQDFFLSLHSWNCISGISRAGRHFCTSTQVRHFKAAGLLCGALTEGQNLRPALQDIGTVVRVTSLALLTSLPAEGGAPSAAMWPAGASTGANLAEQHTQLLHTTTSQATGCALGEGSLCSHHKGKVNSEPYGIRK